VWTSAFILSCIQPSWCTLLDYLSVWYLNVIREELLRGADEYRHISIFLECVCGYSFLDDDMGPVVMHTGCERFLTVTRCG